MITEGELTVRLARDGNRVRDVAIASSRPFAIGRLLVGRAPSEAIALVPRLYSLCAEAQAAAARCAVEAAGGSGADYARDAARETRVMLEIVQEHLWRLLLDWPAATGHDGLPQVVATARRAIAGWLARPGGDGHASAAARAFDHRDARSADADAKSRPLAERADEGARIAGDEGARIAGELAALAGRYVYGMDPGAWLRLADDAALAEWFAAASTLPAALLGELFAHHPGLGRSDVALMPNAAIDTLQEAVVPALRANADFARAPEWAGTPVETGPLARWQAHPLVAAVRVRDGDTAATRMTARLVDLAVHIDRLRGTGEAAGLPRLLTKATLEPGEGIGVVETARGLLLHHVRIEAGRIAAYGIVAPTEWNFHPRGALARGLSGIGATDRAAIERAARIAVQALDPCVGCRIEVTDA